MTIKWKTINTSDMRFYTGSGIFALYGVQNNEVVAVVPLFNWRDFNTDGDVSLSEKAKALLVPNNDIGMLASIFLRIKENSPNGMVAASASAQGGTKLAEMGFEMIRDGIKDVYVKPLVAVAGGKWGLTSSSGAVKQFIVKKGMEQAVLAAVELAAPN